MLITAERACVLGGRRGYAAERERLSRCAYKVAGVDTLLSGRA